MTLWSRSLAYPWIYVVQLAGWFVLFGSLYFAFSFFMARPIAELELGGVSLPSHWDAAYPDHGGFARGYLIAKHPFLFALCVFLLIGAFIAMRLIRIEVIRQTAAGGEPRERAHKIANGISVIVGAGLALAAFRFLIPRVD